jgi:hypothetical protein
MSRREKLEAAAASYEALIEVLGRAQAHCRITAARLRDEDVPRGCAHALAARGELCRVMAELDALAVQHAAHATVD